MERHCLVTGGSRGIGRATALLAASQGWSVSIIGQTAGSSAAREVADSVTAGGGRATVLHGDLAQERDVVRIFEQAEQALGPLRGLVNAAGIAHHGSAADFDAGLLERLMAVNVVGLMLCCREAVRRMSTARGGHGGAIVNMSSMAATIGGRPGASAYAASKAAVDAFSTGLAREVAPVGIRVNVVRPGVVATDMTAAMRADPNLRARIEATVPMGRFGEPEEIAQAAVWLLSGAASFVTGALLDAGGGGFQVAALR